MGKILLFTTSIISERNSSWLLLRQIIKRIDDEKLLILSANFQKPKKKNLIGKKIIWHRLFWKNPILIKIFNNSFKKMNVFIDYYYSKKLAQSIFEICESHQIVKLWILADSIPILTINRIIDKLKVPIHFSIYDEPINNKNLSHYGSNLKTAFQKILSTCNTVDFIIPEMRHYYDLKGLINSKTIYSYSYGGEFKFSINNNILKTKVRKICIGGNVFGLKTFVTFCESIKEVCIRENIVIHIYSNWDFFAREVVKRELRFFREFVKFKPFVKNNDIIQILNSYDILYLPFSFESEDKIKTITSFPSKTHNYLSSTVPIILHAPDYSSINKYLNRYGLCHPITSLQKKNIEKEFYSILELSNRSAIQKNVLKFNANQRNEHMLDLVKKLSTFDSNF
jgi:hypothetical protein